MTPYRSDDPKAQRRWVISLVFMVSGTIIVLAGFGIAFLTLGAQADRIEKQDTLSTYRAKRSDYKACVAAEQIRASSEGAYLFATNPASLEGLTPERLPVVQKVNEDRAEARVYLLSLLPPKFDCTKPTRPEGTR